MDFKNRWIEIWDINEEEGRYCLICKKPKISQKLNNILKQYPAETVFHVGEEPRFLFNKAQIESIASLSTTIGLVFNQLFR